MKTQKTRNSGILGGLQKALLVLATMAGMAVPAHAVSVVNVSAPSNGAYGTVYTGIASTKTFTVSNTGDGTLTIEDIQITGTDAADFTLNTSQMISTLGVGDSSTFTVAINASAAGAKSATLTVTHDAGGVSGTTLDVALTATAEVPLPTMVVKNSSGTTLSSGTTVSYGNVGQAVATTAVFTIENTGHEELNIGSISRTGTNQTMYTIDTTGMTNPLPAGDSTTFAVTFTPSGIGAKTATITVESDTGGIAGSTFTLNLTGTAVTPVSINFSAAEYNVTQTATVAKVTLTRPTKGLIQSVKLQTSDGTSSDVPLFDAAVEDTDYTGVSTTVTFGALETSKVVSITLSPKSGTSVVNRRFNLAISNPLGGAALGAQKTAKVNILSTDVTKPTLVVSNPAASVTSINATLSPTVTVDGTASDAKGLSRVTLQLNTGAATNLVLTQPDRTSATYSTTISPNLGKNTLIVKAYDVKGNFTAVTRTFTYTGGVSLTLARTVPSGKAPDSVGTIAVGAVDPLNAKKVTAPVKATATTHTALALSGIALKITATSKPGYAFTGWSGLPVGSTSVGNVATITMPATATTVTATFAAQPFSGGNARANAAFAGLVDVVGQVAGDNTSLNAGYVSVNLTPTGAFTGKISMDGVVKDFKGQAFSGGNSIFIATNGTLSDTFDFTGDQDDHKLTLTYDASGQNAFAASVENVVEESDSVGTITRGGYTSASKVPTALRGYYTIALTPPGPGSTIPQGDGFLTLTVTDLGAVSGSGQLADGSTVTVSSIMLPNAECPIFAIVTPPAGLSSSAGIVLATAVDKGAITGVLDFAASPSGDDVDSSIWWYRNAAANDGASKLYTDGWPNGLQLGAVGSIYNKTVNVFDAFGFSAVSATNGNGTLTFQYGKLSANVVVTAFNVNDVAANTVTKVSSADASFNLAIGTTGLFSGYFTPTWTTTTANRPKFQGVFIQKGTVKGGRGFFLSNAPADNDPESGWVTLVATD